MNDFSVERFETFCSQLTIDSKERGKVPLRWMGTQRFAIQEISKALKDGVHEIVILKGRQLGITTVTLALDLYWLFKHVGLQGLLVTDTDDNRENFRTLLTGYVNTLPPRLRPGVDRDNRNQLLFKGPKGQTGSRLQYLVAGTKKSGNLGRGKAGSYLHATEMSSWGDEEGYKSLKNTLAQTNPDRLYVFESTARGYDMFFEHYETAKESPTKRAIFVGWWLNEFYRKERDSSEFRTYWDGSPTGDEEVWIKQVYERYKWNISPEQIAWWRWYVHEEAQDDEQMAMQEMPPTEDYAFQLTGSKFFSAERVNIAYKVAHDEAKDPLNQPMMCRYKFGLAPEDTQFIETNDENADCWIWQLPQDDGVYIIGADPAYGSSENADFFAVQVLRCFADKVEQVAEVHTLDMTTAQYAWCIAHLAGAYRGAMLCLEMQGPGGAVFNELQHLKRMVQEGYLHAGPSTAVGGAAFLPVTSMRNYFWSKQDSLTPGFSYQWQTNAKEKLRLMETLRSYFERQSLILHSLPLIQEFRAIARDGDKVGGGGRAKDDLVISLGIAVTCWNDWIIKEMQRDNRTYAREMAPKTRPRETTQLENQVMSYFRSQGITMKLPQPPTR